MKTYLAPFVAAASVKRLQLKIGQAVSTWPDFTIEADCNSGRYRRVYRDGRIEIEG
ncbi:TPA: hypothetical protein P2Q19_002358 [Aeromonas salmonicida]|nr:hypothetical protein [Aeromonas salmonicida]